MMDQDNENVGNEQVEDDDDDFAELDAWLNSGAVEIVPSRR